MSELYLENVASEAVAAAAAVPDSTSVAGTSVAGTSVAGTSVAGTSAAGTSVAGTSVAGTSVAGTSVAGTSASETKVINDWEELNAKTELLRGIYANGFERPSPIQRQAILPIFNKRDIIAQAQSGTGKTACFSIGILQLIDTTKNATQAMILSPTRELSIQTKSVLDAIGRLFPSLCTQLLIGGTSTLAR